MILIHLFSESKCPSECDCLENAKCKWSVELQQNMEDARSANNGKLWNAYVNRFRKHICSYEEQKVCCCGDQQIAPDELEPINDIVPTKSDGKSKLFLSITSKRLFSNFVMQLRWVG